MTQLDVRSPVDPLAGTLSRGRVIPATSTNTAAVTGIWASLRSGEMPREVEVEVELGTGASWLQVMIGDINRIAQLPQNWDSYGGERLKEKAARCSIELLQRLEFGGPAPWVSPTPDGDVHLEWTRSGIGLELEISDTGDVNVLVDCDGSIREWTTGPFGDDELQSLLRQVTDLRPN